MKGDFSIKAGDSTTVNYTVKLDSGSTADLNDYPEIVVKFTKSFDLSPSMEKKLSDSEVTVLTPTTEGRFSIQLVADDTENLKGRYNHEAYLLDNNNNRFTILEAIVEVRS